MVIWTYGHSFLRRTATILTNNPFLRNHPTTPQAYKADVSLLLQGKADSKDLESAAALVRSKVRWGRGLAVAPGDSAYRLSLHGRC